MQRHALLGYVQTIQLQKVQTLHKSIVQIMHAISHNAEIRGHNTIIDPVIHLTTIQHRPCRTYG